MTVRPIVATIALLAAGALAQTSMAATVLSDNFNADVQALNWTGDAVFNSTSPLGDNASTDLIGTGFFDFYPGNGNYVDLDGSTGSGNSPAGQLTSVASFGPGKYNLTFDLGGNARGAVDQTTVVTLGGAVIATIDLASGDPFTLRSYTFTSATGGRLAFTENGPSDNQGNILDNVTLSSAVPEPSTWGMIIFGFGGLGAALRGGRRLTAKAAA